MERYSRTAIVLHWSIAAALAFQLAVGWGLEDLGRRGFALYQLHKSVGIAILVLSLVRLAVRFTRPRPAPVEGGVTGMLAKIVHVGLYAFMIGAPLTGWLLVSSATIKVPTLLFGLLPLPHLPVPEALADFAHGSHGAIAIIGAALFVLHVAGALRHHIMLRDGLIWRMVPGRSTVLLLALLSLVPMGVAVGAVLLSSMATPLESMPPEADATAPADIPPESAIVENSSGMDADADIGNATESADNAAEAEVAVPAGPPPQWTIQPGGTLGFSVSNGADQIKGSFARWTGGITMDPDAPETADIRVTIDLASASVGDAYQDGMLADTEFFGVSANPQAVFRSTSVEKTGEGRYRAQGTLTLKGVSAPQAITFRLSGTGLKRTVTGNATIARNRFGVGTGDSAKDIAPMVAVTFSFAATGKAP